MGFFANNDLFFIAMDISLNTVERGVWPVMLTPFDDELRIDTTALGHLTDFYLSHPIAGLLGTCWSSETNFLTFEELLQVNREVVRRVNGAVAVGATPHAGVGPVPSLQESVDRLFDTGVDYVVLVAARVAAENESEDALCERLENLKGGKFGIYESPSPYHRLLAPETMRRIAASGRFFFHKDTSCNIDKIRPKIAAVRGTPLRFYNAHSPSLLQSLQAGGNGYCGIGANFFPDVYTRMCQCVASDPEQAAQAQSFLDSVESLAGTDYPCNAKAYLRATGVKMGTACRIDRTLTTDGVAAVGKLVEMHEQFTQCLC